VAPRSAQNDLLIELGHVVAERFEEPPPRRGDPEGLARPRVLGSDPSREPTALLYAGDRRVEGPRAESMAVLCELLDQPCDPILRARRRDGGCACGRWSQKCRRSVPPWKHQEPYVWARHGPEATARSERDGNPLGSPAGPSAGLHPVWVAARSVHVIGVAPDRALSASGLKSRSDLPMTGCDVVLLATRRGDVRRLSRPRSARCRM
jgi:hypothetical protein